jgi:hypothetical protein
MTRKLQHCPTTLWQKLSLSLLSETYSSGSVDQYLTYVYKRHYTCRAVHRHTGEHEKNMFLMLPILSKVYDNFLKWPNMKSGGKS